MPSYQDILKDYKFDIKSEEIEEMLKKYNTLMENLINKLTNPSEKEEFHEILEENSKNIEEIKKYCMLLTCIYEQENVFRIDREIRELEEQVKIKKAKYKSSLVRLMRLSFDVSVDGVPVLPSNPRHGMS